MTMGLWKKRLSLRRGEGFEGDVSHEGAEKGPLEEMPLTKAQRFWAGALRFQVRPFLTREGRRALRRGLWAVPAALALLLVPAACIEQEPVFVPVKEIRSVPTITRAGQDLTLTGKVAPPNATNKDITWYIMEAGSTEAALTGNIFSASAPGEAKVTAVIPGGAAEGEDFDAEFTIEVGAPFIPVKEITGVPEEWSITDPLTLQGTVLPANATHKDIVWSIQDTGGTRAKFINSKIITIPRGGVITIQAGIENGDSESPPQDTVKLFKVNATGEFVPVKRISGVPTEAYVGEIVTLTGKVEPENAWNQDIEWSIRQDTESKATKARMIDSTHLYFSRADFTGNAVTIEAVIKNGLSEDPEDPVRDYTDWFVIIVESRVED